MQEWEYITVFQAYDNRKRIYVVEISGIAVEMVAYYNQLGEQGWELVAVSDSVAFFKRPKQ